jgi:uncharacterized DUF497 family protein
LDIFDLLACTGFEWDEGNSEKNWEKHKVSRLECEQLFFNYPIIVAADQKHSQAESRYYALGQSDRGKRLFVVFGIRGYLIRVISARPMNRAERRLYDQEENSEIPE